MRMTALNRRIFLKGSLVGGLAAMTAVRLPGFAAAAEVAGAKPAARVALTAGDDRAANTYRGLQQFRDEIARAIGNRPVVIKPNNVAIDNQLSATHADCIEGILEFLKSLGKAGNAMIAESAADGPTLDRMGIDFAKVGYLNFCADAGLGQADLKKIEVVGEPVARHVKTYQLADNIEAQMIWKKPAHG